MDVTTATPAEIDTEIARLNAEQAELARRIEMLRAQMDANAKTAAPLHAEYDRRGGWTRVYRVDNSNGHVHTSTACSTTYETTDFHWFPELSGKDAAEIVELAGEYTCLVCFGRVREEILKAREGRPCRIETPGQRKTREECEAAAAAKAAKDAAKDAKKLVRPVTVPRSSFRIETKAAAWTELVTSVIDAEEWADPTRNPRVSAAQCKANHDDYTAAVEILRAVLIESLPEMTPQEFEALLTKKVKARKAAYNRQLKQAGYPPRY